MNIDAHTRLCGLLGNPVELAQQRPWLSVVSLLLVTLTYSLVTSTLLALLTSRLTAQPYLAVIRRDLRGSGMLELGTAAIGGLLGFLWAQNPWWTLVLLFPASLAYSKEFYPTLVATFKALMPLVRFLNEPLVEKKPPARFL